MEKKFDYAFFDFDGTIADTSPGIFESLRYAFTALGYEVPDEAQLVKMIGPPLTEGFEDVFGFRENEVADMIEKYREKYRAGGLYNCVPYNGIEALFARLKKNGVSLSLSSSKPLPFVKELLEKFDMTDYFDFISCPPIDGVHMTKTDIINLALKENNVKDKSRAVMVGDRFYDIVGAKQAGIPVIAVLYGFGSKAEFEKYNADFVANDTKSVGNIILGE